MSDQRKQLDSDKPQWETWSMASLKLVDNKYLLADGQETSEHEEAFLTQEQGFHAGYEEGFGEGRRAGHKEGFSEGKEEGFSKGLADAQAQSRRDLETQVKQLLQPITHLVEQFETAMAGLDENISEQLVALALTAGRQLARTRLDEDESLVLETVRELLHLETSPLCKPCLWLHPEDLKIVQEFMKDEITAAEWRLQPDPMLTRGGCKLTTSNEEHDATWETRCAAVMSTIRQRSQNEPSEKTVEKPA